MRYSLSGSTLIVRGRFHACSTGSGGGIRPVTTLLNHTVPPAFSADPDLTIHRILQRNGFFPRTAFGLLTAVPMETLCILRYDLVTVFITAGVTHPDPAATGARAQDGMTGGRTGTINIICCITGGMADQGLLDALITVTEAKALALGSAGYPFAGTVTDAVIIAAEGEGDTRYAGSATTLGRSIHESVLHGVRVALRRYEEHAAGQRAGRGPAFFVHTTMGADRWIEWQKEGCPYYPCHYPGQRCDFCYCPLYPCEDESLGEWSAGSSGRGRVWSCAPCTLNHQPAVVRHLRRNPEASLRELKSLSAQKSGNQ